MLTKVTMSSYQLCPRNRQSRGFLSVVGIATFVVVVSLSTCVAGFYVPPSSLKTKQSTTRIEAKPQRLPENVEGALYVNSKVNTLICVVRIVVVQHSISIFRVISTLRNIISCNSLTDVVH